KYTLSFLKRQENYLKVVLQFDKFGSKTNVMPAPCQARGKLQLASSAQFSGFRLEFIPLKAGPE
ncbi:MAG: hypothetical protein KGJ59_14820, partial [Bacteroidota bacterium]|nr:hypothetical protein [Bacteroidota bacterium]